MTSSSSIEHLLSVLSAKYTFKVDWTGSSYLGMTIKHNRRLRVVNLTMPGYYSRMLSVLGITKGTRDPGSPIVYIAPTYGTRGPLLEESDDSALLEPECSLSLNKRLLSLA